MRKWNRVAVIKYIILFKYKMLYFKIQFTYVTMLEIKVAVKNGFLINKMMEDAKVKI